MIGNLPDLGYWIDVTWPIVTLWNLFVDWWNPF
ncbi:hypothetical protein C8E05_6311 [Rhodococcus wratislaviensis]|uniref:Uncharacterized protein n=1 Tax=Rhodococcus wratislaviensis TaxID=44752 RepID=A0AB38FGA9_RHOWR|nr:hypothetical protein C8E05_6311 [Rhodococcus wratislaviensis]SPZ40390.1 Uncharacterised protein [Rhodococcus wratislaviensis]